ncbi:DUF5327 family protein [Oceanobacillus sp. FSL H7-0719]|uniref:DUF5327 family protein n=1 Tax=Oceanobacillus sp. FSL H7-0719 TaxID=2954507 RepID=UPI00324F01DF
MNNLTVINKMIRELEAAKYTEQRQDLLQHISNVQLLCELFLEEETAPASKTSVSVPSAFSDQEIKAMLGEDYNRQAEKRQDTNADHEDANGNSIFDF